MKYFSYAAVILVLAAVLMTGCQNQYMEAGNIYLRQGDFEKALYQFEEASKIEPNNYVPYIGLARAYGYMKDYPRSAEYMLKAMNVDTTGNALKEMQNEYEFFWAVLYNAGVGFRNNDDAAEKFETYEKYLKTAESIKDTFRNYDNLVLLYIAVGDEKKMLESYEKSVENYPENLAIMFNVAKYYIDAKKYENAKSYLEEARKLDEKNPSIAYYLGYMNYTMGKNDAALKEFKNLETIYNGLDEAGKKSNEAIYQDALALIGSIYKLQKKYSDSADYYKKAYEMNQDDMNALYDLGMAYYLAQKYNESIETINLYMEKTGDESSNLYLILSDCYNKKKNTEKALEYYKKYDELKKQGK